MMLESEIQAKVIKRMEMHGWYVIKLIQTNRNGIPDLLAHRRGKTIYLEIKRPGLKPTPLQDQRHRELMRSGIVVHTIKSVDELYLYGILTQDYDTTSHHRHSQTIPGPDREVWEPGMD